MSTASKLALAYLPAAVDDLAGIFDWLGQESPARAAALLQRMDKRVGALAAHPRLGRVPRHPHLAQAGYRVLVVDAYLVFYAVLDGVIEVHRVIHGSRSLEDLI